MLKKKISTFFFILPAVLILILVVIFPLVYSIYVSLLDYDLRRIEVHFIGLKNYMEAFRDERFINSLVRTFQLMSIALPIQISLGLFLALLLYYHLGRVRKYIILILSLPPMISPVVIGYMGRLIFHPGASPVNYLFEVMGLGIKPQWHASAHTSLLTIALVDSWQWTPFVMLLFLSGLFALPKEILESARVDGATIWKEIRYIVLPLLKPVAVVAILFRALDMLRIFDTVYILTYGGPGTSSEVVSFYAYVTGFNYWKIGYGAALSWILAIILSILVTLYLKYVMKTF